MTKYFVNQTFSNAGPDITVVVAVKNGADTLEACLDSILSQEGPNVDVIVVDGSSTDGTLEIMERYRPRLFAVLNDANLGVYDAWNRAIGLCHSPWIAFLGCDDRYSDKWALAKLLGAAQNSCDQPVLAYSKVSHRNANDRELAVVGQPWQIARKQLTFRMSVHHGGALHSRELFNAGGFDASFRIVGDYEFLYRQRDRLAAVFVDEPLVFARLGGLSTRSDLAITQKLEVKRIFKMHRAGIFANLYWYLGMSATLASLALARIRNLTR
jgi:glycosyltransferase involved in cell wall biosynthesis